MSESFRYIQEMKLLFQLLDFFYYNDVLFLLELQLLIFLL